jgi:hypothetical protein
MMEEEASHSIQKNVDISETPPVKRPKGKETGNIRKKAVPVSAIPRDAGTIFPVGIEKYLKRKGWKIEKFTVGKRNLILTISIPMSKAHFRTVKKVKIRKT